MSLLATSELSHDAVKKHQDTVLSALKVCTTITDNLTGHVGMLNFCLLLDHAEVC